MVCYMLPDSYLPGGTLRWCFDCAWHHVQSAAHMYMLSLYLTSQVGIPTHWCWACIQCSFHWNWRLLEGNKHSLKGYRCPKIQGLWKSQTITLAKENLVGLYVTFDSMALLTHHCWSSFTPFPLATLTVVFQKPEDGYQHSAGHLLPKPVWDQQHCLDTSGKAKTESILIQPNPLSTVFRINKVSKTGVNTADFNVILFWKTFGDTDSHSTLNLKSGGLAIKRKPH